MKCPQCGAVAVMTAARPKPGQDPLLREYKCKGTPQHRWVEMKGRGQPDPKGEKEIPMLQLPLPEAGETVGGREHLHPD